MRRFVLAVALACALSGPALAGDVHTIDAPAPPASSPVTTIVILTIIRIVVR